MAALGTGVGLLLFSFLCQLILWRIALPTRQTIGLLTVFTLAPLIGLTLIVLSRHTLPSSASQAFAVLLFYVAFSLAYIVCYSAIENESPTLAIVSYVARAGKNGCAHADLVRAFGYGAVMEDRFALMERGGWVISDSDSGIVHLSNEGRIYARLFGAAANMFGIGKGG